MAYINPTTQAPLNILTAAYLNTYVRDNMRFLHNSPMCIAYRPSDQSIADSSWSAQGMSSVLVDTDNISSVGTPSSFTIQTPGVYNINATARWATNGTGRRLMRINRNTGTLLASVQNITPSAAIPCDLNASAAWAFAAGDTIQIEVRQNSGSGLNLQASDTPLGYSINVLWVGAGA